MGSALDHETEEALLSRHWRLLPAPLSPSSHFDTEPIHGSTLKLIACRGATSAEFAEEKVALGSTGRSHRVSRTSSRHGGHLAQQLFFGRGDDRQGRRSPWKIRPSVARSSSPLNRRPELVRFPNLVAASLGAIRKDQPDGTITARVLFDGTHGISVAMDGTTFNANSGRERRLQAVHLLGCQVQKGSDVRVLSVGTVGVASASSGPECRNALLMFLIRCATSDIPLSQARTSGGDKVVWVGFELLHSTQPPRDLAETRGVVLPQGTSQDDNWK